jgi:hypothetical protein
LTSETQAIHPNRNSTTPSLNATIARYAQTDRGLHLRPRKFPWTPTDAVLGSRRPHTAPRRRRNDRIEPDGGSASSEREAGESTRARTSIIAELDVGLGSVGVELGGCGPGVDGLGVELGGELEVVVDEGLLGLARQIRRGHVAPPPPACCCGGRRDETTRQKRFGFESEQKNRGRPS